MVSTINKRFLFEMKVTICQFDIKWADIKKNIETVENLISREPDSDLYVLPEMWSTGFATEPQGIAEIETESLALQWMIKTSKKYNCAICGSLAVYNLEESSTANKPIYKNRQYFINGRKGTVSYYDKHHLFQYGHEDKYYKAGNNNCIVEYNGFRFLLLTCYDLRFPVWSRYSEKLNYDAIIVVANWPESRQNAWQILTRARAIENQAYLIACNRVGSDKYCLYRGQSSIIDPKGLTLVSCPANTQTCATFTLDLETIYNFRKKFQVLKDRDIL